MRYCRWENDAKDNDHYYSLEQVKLQPTRRVIPALIMLLEQVNVLTSLRQEANALWTGGKGELLLVIATGWGLLNGLRAIYPILLPSVADMAAPNRES